MLFARFWQNRDGGVAPFLAIAADPADRIDRRRRSTIAAPTPHARPCKRRSTPPRSACRRPRKARPATRSRRQAQPVFNALFIRPEVENVSVNTNLSSPQQGNFVLNITGSGTIKTYFAKVIGHSEMSFGSTSEVLWGIKKLNLALALDNTGSMNSSGKMTALKTAAHNLLDTLKKAEKTPGDIKVSIVPFAVDVNAGTQNVDATWIDWEDWDAANGNCSKSWYHSKIELQQQRRHLDAERPQRLERLRQRPRPEQRRHQHADRIRRRDQIPRASGRRPARPR